jgi:glutamate N-acetyltransferase/amino-acid N-acetyltransferase
MTAKFLNIKIDDVLVASTGVIGMQLDMNKIIKGIKKCTASLKRNAFKDVAKSIMTTDSYMKVASESFKVAKKEVTISGMVKGAGMIHPNMATMLCFILTDANIHYSALKEAMMSSVKKTFNCMTVDGDTSTSDMAIILANGMAENKIIEKKGNAFAEFSKHLYTICEKLAKMIAADGEGATKLIEINILNCRTEQEGEKIAKKIATSTLFKTAMFGNDPNWGRIICAIGNSGVNFNPDKIIVDINNITVFINGMPADYDEKKLKKSLAKNEIFVTVDLNQDKEKCRVWTCDLTYDYVKINASYRT